MLEYLSLKMQAIWGVSPKAETLHILVCALLGRAVVLSLNRSFT